MSLAISPSEDKLAPKEIQRGENPGLSKLGGHSHDTPLIVRRRVSGNRKPMRFKSLHHHSTFSYKDGFQLPEAHVRRATEIQMDSFAMSEHGNTDSHVRFEKAAQAAGVKPIFGCEIYMDANDDIWDETQAQRKFHLTVLARNALGYRNLLSLVSTSWAEGFFHNPTVTMRSLIEHKEGLIILSGCQGSRLFCSAVGGKTIEPENASYAKALKIARFFVEHFGDAYFPEVQAFPELELTCKANPIIARIAKAIGRPLVATMDVHYTLLEEAEVQLILHNIRGGGKQTVEEQAREWGYDVPLCPPPNDRSIWRRLQLTGLSKEQAAEAIVATEEIAAECNVTLPKLPMIRFPVPKGFVDAHAYWEHALKEGWRFRGCDRFPAAKRKLYREQLMKEKALIESKDYLDYFLLVAMGVRFCKDRDIPVGPARGSAAASLACYLLRITEIDPLDPIFGGLLVFERFIDETREDLPDIDLDFPSEARPMLREFYASVFGEECVSNVGTFTVFKNKLALDDVARVFRIPQFEVNKVKDFLIERSSGDLRASSTIEDTVEQFPQARAVFEEFPDLRKGALLEGNIKGFGVHAAGIVLSNGPMREVCAVYTREIPKGSGNFVQAIGLDKYDAERQGLNKMDFLGLSTMTMIWDSLRTLGLTIDDLYTLPLDDERVYAAFAVNDVVGVFQFDGKAQRSVSGMLRPERFSELMDCTALARPGPLHNGAATAYAAIKNGKQTAQKIHPAVDNITQLTQYQIVYQEQILRIVREVGNFSWTHAAYIRKIISRKLGEAEFNRQWETFRDGCLTVHERMDVPEMSEAVAKETWGSMITSGSYAFNAAHCAAYALLAYWTMWIKVYHPDVFYAASLAVAQGGGDKPKQKRYSLLRDAAKEKPYRSPVRVRPPSPKHAAVSWRPVRRRGGPLEPPTIRAGFESVEGVGEKTALAIVEHRRAHGLEGWDDLIDVKGIGPKTIETIREWSSKKDPFGAFTLDTNISAVKAEIAAGKLELPFPTHTAADLPYDPERDEEVIWLGTILQRNVRDIFEQNRARTGEELAPEDVKDPHLNEWAQLTCEDETEELRVRIDRWRYPKFKHAIFDFRMGVDLLLVEGIRPRIVNFKQIKVKNLYVIAPD